MANAKHVERRLTRLKAKYAAQGGSPKKLRRIAEVKAKHERKAAQPVVIEVHTGPATDALIDVLRATTEEAEAMVIGPIIDRKLGESLDQAFPESIISTEETQP